MDMHSQAKYSLLWNDLEVLPWGSANGSGISPATVPTVQMMYMDLTG
jgi:hypothetical protein